MSDILMRPATTTDAEAAALVLRRSIAELCVPDHGNDPDILDPWLANKTPAMFLSWIAVPDSTILVADSDGTLAGVGGCRHDGEIILNYVSPDFRLMGVSTALLAALEAELRRHGVAKAVLDSTRTAHDFYLARGYVDDGAPQSWRGDATAQKMTKAL